MFMQKNLRERGAVSGTWIAIGAVVLVFILLVVAKLSGPGTGPSDVIGTATSWKNGPDTAKAKLLEYGDFQCPACATYYPFVEQLQKDFPTDLQLQFRHLPLVSIHQHAMNAARATEAAGKQGKFWEMYDQIYKGQKEWSVLTDARLAFEKYATDIGLDVAQYKIDVANKDLTDGAINADIAEFNKLGIPMSTPTFVLNGKVITEANMPRSYDAFKKLIEGTGAVAVSQQEIVVPVVKK
ncbi:MAG TPA: thioredoxin domain-containing protein [Candidatus Paceibacterota bacterium]